MSVILTVEQCIMISAALAAAPEKALVSSEGCEHLFLVRWKEGKAVCLLCRTVIDGSCDYGISLRGPYFNPLGLELNPEDKNI